MTRSPCDELQVAYVVLTAGQIRLGEPLPWPVYNAKGKLLLNKGFVIASAGQLERLLEQGLYQARVPRAADAATAAVRCRINPFAEFEELRGQLESALERLLTQHSEVERRVLALSKSIATLCQADVDACLALIHLNTVNSSPHEQALFHAILCNLLACQLQLTDTQTMTLVAAALTANVALLPHQEKLNGLRGELSPAQRSIINKHPALSAQALQTAGVVNTLWLQIVEQHHECHSGRGYPLGLAAEQICIEARILSLAERYIAMVTRRAYRDRLNPSHAMQRLEEECLDDTTETALVSALQQILSPYPPGCFFRLHNNETAIVIRRSADILAPKVRAVTNAKGNPYLGSFSRDTQHEDFRLREYQEPLHLPLVNFSTLWGYG